MYEICSKLTIKNVVLISLLLTLNKFETHLSCVSIVDWEKSKHRLIKYHKHCFQDVLVDTLETHIFLVKH